MKQSFFALGIFIFIACGQASAQTTETSFIIENPIISSLPTGNIAGTIETVKVSSTALDRFHKEYKEAKDVKWVEVTNGYRAYFLQDAVVTAVDYTKKGRLYGVIRYGKHLLDRHMRSLLKNAFDDIQIREVAEVKMAEFSSHAYVVVLEDSISLKTIQVIENEISVIHEVNK